MRYSFIVRISQGPERATHPVGELLRRQLGQELGAPGYQWILAASLAQLPLGGVGSLLGAVDGSVKPLPPTHGVSFSRPSSVAICASRTSARFSAASARLSA